MSRLDDPAAVAAQYAAPGNFDARVRLYQRYARMRPTWIEWLWDRFALAPGERVLDVGAGTGNLWAENRERIPSPLAPVLLDRSGGMLAAAAARLGDFASACRFERADACALPFRDGAFDVVVANHMLYHVPERGRAIAELSRVLAARGRCGVATNEADHQVEIRRLVERFEVTSTMVSTEGPGFGFDLDQARIELEACFDDVQLHRRRECLAVDDAAVVGDYVRSACPADAANLARIQALEEHVAECIASDGAFEIQVAAGVCIAR